MRCRARTFAVSIVLLSLALFLSGQSPTLAEGNRKAQNAVGIPNCDRSQLRLFLDVGHTAEAFGATSLRETFPSMILIFDLPRKSIRAWSMPDSPKRFS